MTSVGIVGTGRMGSAMARALARSEVPLVLHNRTADRARALAEEVGGRVAASPAEVAGAVDVCITMLADEAAVESTYRGPDGLLAGARPGVVLVDMSTVPPATIRRLAPGARERAAGILDAPVSGSTALAEAGELTIMVGGEAADLDLARPVLDVLAKRVFHIGPLGSGAAMKLAVNAVIFGLNGALSEALVLAERSGIDPAAAYEVFATSAAGAPFVGYKRAAFLEPDRTPTAFALELAEKDLRLIAGLADAVGLPVPQARTNLDVIRAAVAAEGADGDLADVASYLRDAAVSVGEDGAGRGEEGRRSG